MHTKFSKLQVGKHIVSAKQTKSSGNQLFPLSIALIGLYPLQKVQVDYQPLPKNTFVIRVNDAEYHSLIREEVDYDPTKTEELNVKLNINDKKDINDQHEWAIDGLMPWILDDVEDRIQGIMGTDPLTGIHIESLNCK